MVAGGWFTDLLWFLILFFENIFNVFDAWLLDVYTWYGETSQEPSHVKFRCAGMGTWTFSTIILFTWSLFLSSQALLFAIKKWFLFHYLLVPSLLLYLLLFFLQLITACLFKLRFFVCAKFAPFFCHRVLDITSLFARPEFKDLIQQRHRFSLQEWTHQANHPSNHRRRHLYLETLVAH